MTAKTNSLGPERILVTGGAGFIGSHTVDLLLEQGKHVTVFDNLSSGKSKYLPLDHPHLVFIEGDILDYPLLQSCLIECDAVLHLAAISSVPLSIEKPISSFEVNVRGFLHVLQAIHQAARPMRLVYASSAAVYGEVKNLPCSDETPLTGEALSPYSLHKMMNEQYAGLYARLYGLSSLALRYFNVYGQRQDPNSPYSGVISRFLHAYQQDTLLTVFGNGHQSRDFIHVSDVARANCLALQNQYNGALNIATGQQQTLLDLISAIEMAGQKPVKRCFAPARPGDIQSSYAAVNRAERYLGFHSTVPLSEGVRLLINQLS